MAQLAASPTARAYSTTCLFNTGREPGIPVHTGQVCVFGAPPNSVEQPQKIFVFVASSTWTSRPITVSYCFLIFIFTSNCPENDAFQSFSHTKLRSSWHRVQWRDVFRTSFRVALVARKCTPPETASSPENSPQ